MSLPLLLLRGSDGDGGSGGHRAIEPIISGGICWRLISFIEHRAGFGSIEQRARLCAGRDGTVGRR